MTCQRCGGFLVLDHPCVFCSSDPDVLTTEEPVDMWRCVNCGCLTDAKIAENRRKQHEAKILRQAEMMLREVV